MTDKELKEQILRMKEERKALFLVHNYQRPEIQDLADYLGDSLGLSQQAASHPAQLIVFCGVLFMAESAKILSPQKKVLLPNREADCFMAGMVDVQGLRSMKKQYPDAKVVCYVNTNADVKAESDVCCTSANAVKVVEGIDADTIIFVPDRNLAAYAQRFTRKRIIPWQGYCYVHTRITPEDVLEAKKKHPGAVFIAHPECEPPVIDLADKVLSTGGMVKFAKESAYKKFIVGTEEGILYRLKKDSPEKEFYTAGSAKMCWNMKINTLEDVYLSLKEDRYQVEVNEGILKKARVALDRMLLYT
jgi:quinolinate synthase